MRWIRVQLALLDFALSSLVRRKGRNLSLAAVFCLLVMCFASVVFAVKSLQREAASLLEGAPDIVVQRVVGGRHDLIPVQYLGLIKSLKGVQESTPRVWGYYYDPGSGANYTLMGTRCPDPSLEEGSVLVGSGVLRTFSGLEHGRIILRSAKGSFVSLKLKGTFPSDSELLSSDLVLICEKDLRELFDIPDHLATDIIARVANPAERRKVAEKIYEALPDTRPIQKEEILRTYEAIFEWRGGLTIVVLSALILSFLILAWDKAVSLGPEETQEIGVLKALGWDTSEVVRMKLMEGLLISITGFAVGIFLAYLHVFLLSAFLFEPLLKGWSVVYPRFPLIPAFGVHDLLVIFLLTVGPYSLATIVPHWRTATIDPQIAMRAQK